jgi:hypothetical protein
MNQNSETRDGRFDDVTKSLAYGAQYHLSCVRDEEDNYVIRFKGTEENALLKEDVVPLMPKGSQWRPGLDWRSFFGRFLNVRGRCWLALGGQRIVPHPSRGAYPIFRAYLFPFDHPHSTSFYGRPVSEVTQALSRAVGVLSANPTPLTIGRGVSGVIKTENTTPSDHIRLEASIMEAANDAYQFGRHLEFSTLILCDGEFEDLGAHHGCGETGDASFIVGTVPSITRSFSKQHREWLQQHGLSGQNRSMR